MSKFKKILDIILDLFGFKKNSKYVTSHLNDANVKSSLYMGGVILVIEIFMIFRQIAKYVTKYWNIYDQKGFSSQIDLLFSYTSLYLLFIVAAIAVIVFAVSYIYKLRSKKSFIINVIVGCICILWVFLLIPERLKGTQINISTTILLYASLPVFGLSLIGNSVSLRYRGKNNTILSIVMISSFAFVCLLFGIKVGYSDFANIAMIEYEGFDIERVKMITCFFTMTTFVACLLIWKPYITILMMTSIFILFSHFLNAYEYRDFLDGDRINYYTFLISMTVIAISIYQQRIAEARKDELLIHEANYDHLTDIHNVKSNINVIIDNYKNNPLANLNKIYLFTNVANFRTINDNRGFGAGDNFLKELAVKVEQVFEGDLVSRQSDDHFVIFADEEKFLDRIEELSKIIDELADGLYVRLKVGGYKPKFNESPYHAIDKARYACGMIKNKYGVKYLEYDDKIDEKFQKRQYIINHLDEAIEKEWIVAYYQPVVWSSNHELCGAEALARWIDPKYGFLSPGDFIPILEDTRLIHKLDMAIIEYVCKYMRRALDNGHEVVPISLNFSRLDFELMNVEKFLNDMITKYDIDKKNLHVEITESALSDNPEFLNQTINKLKDSGYSIWLDDFGSGYSSLNVLKDFEFDVIKIDMKFLSNFEKNEKTKDVIDCIIQLANRLGMKTLTEGVETEEQSKFLEKVGCGRLQGYLYGKPFKLDDFESQINEGKLKIAKNIL